MSDSPNEYFLGDKDKQTKKTVTSSFFITVNSNRVVLDKNDPYVQEFKEIVNRTLGDFKRFIKTNPGYEPDPDLKVVPKKGAIEIGKLQKRVHCHLHLNVVHCSNIGVNGKVLTDAFKEHNFYVNSRFFKSNADKVRIQEYIMKDQ